MSEMTEYWIGEIIAAAPKLVAVQRFVAFADQRAAAKDWGRKAEAAGAKVCVWDLVTGRVLDVCNYA